jgi:hypothetical protein
MRMFALVMLLALSTAQVFAQRMYDSSGRPIGRVDGERYYDSSGRPIGRVEGYTVYDGSGRPLGRIDGDRVYDASGRPIGRIQGFDSYLQQPIEPIYGHGSWRRCYVCCSLWFWPSSSTM